MKFFRNIPLLLALYCIIGFAEEESKPTASNTDLVSGNLAQVIQYRQQQIKNNKENRIANAKNNKIESLKDLSNDHPLWIEDYPSKKEISIITLAVSLFFAPYLYKYRKA